MKKNLFTLLFMLVVPFCFAQDKAEQAVASAFEQWRTAVLNVDKAGMEATLSPTLSYSHSSFSLDTKEAFIESVMSGKSRFKNMTITEQSITVNGKMAVVRHRLEADTSNNGQDGHVKLGVVQVWQKEGGNWRMAVRHACKFL